MAPRGWTTSTLAADADSFRRSGDWDSRLLGSYLHAAAQQAPLRTAVVDGAVRLTYAQLADAVAAMAGALQGRLGVRPGEVVSWQLPNWWEALVVHHAIIEVGAVSNPLMPILRARELEFMLAQAGSRVLFAPQEFRGFNYAAMAVELAGSLPLLEHHVVVRPTSSGQLSFDALLTDNERPDAVTQSADDPVLLLYTSGTESNPKGALHSHNTLGYECRTFCEMFSLGGDDVVFMPSPVGHITGVLYGLHLPSMLAAPVVFQDIWDPAVALQLMQRERCSFMVGATPFLYALTYHPALDEHDVAALRVFVCGGADVSPVLVRDATERLDTCVLRAYGSTEFPTATASGPADPIDRRAETDGRPIARAQVEIRRKDGTCATTGEVGEIHVRGPERFLGYLDAEVSARAFDSNGWFVTGDLGSVDAEGFLTVRGRKKDIIIRGGENISAKEVEDLMLEHPAVADVAVVAMPDPVMTERVCAFVVPAEGEVVTLGELVRWLTDRRIAKQKLPERLEVIDELPRTPSGKIKKFELRDRIAHVCDSR